MVFPSSPTVGQVFSSGGRSWVWNGATWDSPARDNPTIQGIIRTFANAAARTAELPSPTEGTMTYLNDTDQIDVWNGSAWIRRVSTSLPFAQAVGAGYGGAAVTTVTFPAGRFTVAPQVVVINYENQARQVNSISTSNFVYQNIGGANASFTYIATQMTSGSAVG
jgi:hypothetical protein